MVLQSICPPALIYLVFSITQIVIDTVKGMYNVAFIKIWVTLLFTILLNFLCSLGLGIVSWIIVFIPFILMTVIITLLLVMFGLDPITGRRPKVTFPKHKKHKKPNLLTQTGVDSANDVTIDELNEITNEILERNKKLK